MYTQYENRQIILVKLYVRKYGLVFLLLLQVQNAIALSRRPLQCGSSLRMFFFRCYLNIQLINSFATNQDKTARTNLSRRSYVLNKNFTQYIYARQSMTIARSRTADAHRMLFYSRQINVYLYFPHRNSVRCLYTLGDEP